MSNTQRIIEKTTPVVSAIGITWPTWWPPNLDQTSNIAAELIPIFAAVAGFFYALVMARKWWVGSWFHSLWFKRVLHEEPQIVVDEEL